MRNDAIELYEEGSFDRAVTILEKVRIYEPEDGQTLFYLGVSYEYMGEIDKALEVYGRYAKLDGVDRRFRARMLGRIEALNRARFEEYAKAMVAQEGETPAGESTGGVAVMRFEGRSTSSQPLALGLAELLTTDLSKARSLTVVERLRIDAILKELELGQSGMVDLDTAPRMGHLVGAQKLVSGTLSDVEGGKIRIDAFVIRTDEGSLSEATSTTGSLEDFFNMEKDLAFGIIDDLGIRLTIEEENAIREVPTRDFLAFQAYCEGLSFQSRGQYREAMGKFNEAFNRDGGFMAAGAKAAAMSDIMAGVGSAGAAGAEVMTQTFADITMTNETLVDQMGQTWSQLGFYPRPQGFDPSGPRTTLPGPARGSIDVFIRLPRRP